MTDSTPATATHQLNEWSKRHPDATCLLIVLMMAVASVLLAVIL